MVETFSDFFTSFQTNLIFMREVLDINDDFEWKVDT